MARSAVALVSLAAGAVAWVALVLSAVFAIGNASGLAAVALGVGGTGALLGLVLSLLGFRPAADKPVLLTGSALGLLVSGAAGVVALVFAFSFHW